MEIKFCLLVTCIFAVSETRGQANDQLLASKKDTTNFHDSFFLRDLKRGDRQTVQDFLHYHEFLDTPVDILRQIFNLNPQSGTNQMQEFSDIARRLVLLNSNGRQPLTEIVDTNNPASSFLARLQREHGAFRTGSDFMNVLAQINNDKQKQTQTDFSETTASQLNTKSQKDIKVHNSLQAVQNEIHNSLAEDLDNKPKIQNGIASNVTDNINMDRKPGLKLTSGGKTQSQEDHLIQQVINKTASEKTALLDQQEIKLADNNNEILPRNNIVIQKSGLFSGPQSSINKTLTRETLRGIDSIRPAGDLVPDDNRVIQFIDDILARESDSNKHNRTSNPNLSFRMDFTQLDSLTTIAPATPMKSPSTRLPTKISKEPSTNIFASFIISNSSKNESEKQRFTTNNPQLHIPVSPNIDSETSGKLGNKITDSLVRKGGPTTISPSVENFEKVKGKDKFWRQRTTTDKPQRAVRFKILHWPELTTQRIVTNDPTKLSVSTTTLISNSPDSFVTMKDASEVTMKSEEIQEAPSFWFIDSQKPIVEGLSMSETQGLNLGMNKKADINVQEKVTANDVNELSPAILSQKDRSINVEVQNVATDESSSVLPNIIQKQQNHRLINDNEHSKLVHLPKPQATEGHIRRQSSHTPSLKEDRNRLLLKKGHGTHAKPIDIFKIPNVKIPKSDIPILSHATNPIVQEADQKSFANGNSFLESFVQPFALDNDDAATTLSDNGFQQPHLIRTLSPAMITPIDRSTMSPGVKVISRPLKNQNDLMSDRIYEMTLSRLLKIWYGNTMQNYENNSNLSLTPLVEPSTKTVQVSVNGQGMFDGQGNINGQAMPILPMFKTLSRLPTMPTLLSNARLNVKKKYY